MWSDHGGWMWGMGGAMGVGWIRILIAIVAIVWLLARGPLHPVIALRLATSKRNGGGASLQHRAAAPADGPAASR
jgi:hypothetical protein